MVTFHTGINFIFSSRVNGLNTIVALNEGIDAALHNESPVMPDMYDKPSSESLGLGDQWFLTETDLAPYYYIHSALYGADYAFTNWMVDDTDNQGYSSMNKTGGGKGGGPRTMQYWRFDRSAGCAGSYEITNYYRGESMRLGVREGHRPYLYEAPPEACWSLRDLKEVVAVDVIETPEGPTTPTISAGGGNTPAGGGSVEVIQVVSGTATVVGGVTTVLGGTATVVDGKSTTLGGRTSVAGGTTSTVGGTTITLAAPAGSGGGGWSGPTSTAQGGASGSGTGGPSIAVIAGAAVGGVVGLAVVVLAVWFLLVVARRRRRRSEEENMGGVAAIANSESKVRLAMSTAPSTPLPPGPGFDGSVGYVPAADTAGEPQDGFHASELQGAGYVGQHALNKPESPSATPGMTELPSPTSPTAAELSSGASTRARDISSVPSHWVGELSWADRESLEARRELPAQTVHMSELHSSSAASGRAELASEGSQLPNGVVQMSELYSSSSGGAVRAELASATTEISRVRQTVQMIELSSSSEMARIELASSTQAHAIHEVSATGWTVQQLSGSVSMQRAEMSSGSVRREAYGRQLP
ncbi:hypothetical protein B0T16DRAFT_512075 [Cercophora newfieldiana]|uniref:Uncharacterized protein n=1 Tax=Cercophora newfieldiana TaxID=92897 RepID=A0AA39XZA3_9PEZI|nr:hypothetical protein B0T16DRAFT_512075 [Cercophora newfieldiana]